MLGSIGHLVSLFCSCPKSEVSSRKICGSVVEEGVLLVFVIVEPTLFISIGDALVSRHLVLVDRMRRPFVEAESNTVRVRQWGIV